MSIQSRIFCNFLVNIAISGVGKMKDKIELLFNAINQLE